MEQFADLVKIHYLYYKNHPNYKKLIPKGWREIEGLSDKNSMAFENENEIVLAMRGLDIKSLEDVGIGVNIIVGDIMNPRGFDYETARGKYKDILLEEQKKIDIIKENYPNKKLILTGHSRGGRKAVDLGMHNDVEFHGFNSGDASVVRDKIYPLVLAQVFGSGLMPEFSNIEQRLLLSDKIANRIYRSFFRLTSMAGISKPIVSASLRAGQSDKPWSVGGLSLLQDVGVPALVDNLAIAIGGGNPKITDEFGIDVREGAGGIDPNALPLSENSIRELQSGFTERMREAGEEMDTGTYIRPAEASKEYGDTLFGGESSFIQSDITQPAIWGRVASLTSAEDTAYEPPEDTFSEIYRAWEERERDRNLRIELNIDSTADANPEPEPIDLDNTPISPALQREENIYDYENYINLATSIYSPTSLAGLSPLTPRGWEVDEETDGDGNWEIPAGQKISPLQSIQQAYQLAQAPLYATQPIKKILTKGNLYSTERDIVSSGYKGSKLQKFTGVRPEIISPKDYVDGFDPTHHSIDHFISKELFDNIKNNQTITNVLDQEIVINSRFHREETSNNNAFVSEIGNTGGTGRSKLDVNAFCNAFPDLPECRYFKGSL